jgi:type I restriction enzyme S subunit
MATSQDFVNWVCGPNIEPQFLKYVLVAEKEALWRFASGTTHQTIYYPEAKAFHVCLPSIAEQKAIVQILGVLDDKIELNRRMNATLEAMTRALFQSWFVDFDPVRAKLDGRQPPGVDPATASLFPDRFEKSSLEMFPSGWTIGRVDDALVLQRGFDLPATARTDGPYPVIAASGPSGVHSDFRARGPGVSTGRSGLLGKVFFVHGDFWPLNTALWIKEFRRASPTYAYHLLRELALETFNVGSAVPSLNRNHVHRLPLVLPPRAIVDAFERHTFPLMQRQAANEAQSRTLAALRDILLPKLLSGELRVADAVKEAQDTL